MSRWIIPLALVVSLQLLSGCGHVISAPARQSLSPGIDHRSFWAEPQLYQGKTLLLGGSIVALEVSADGSLLEINPWRLDSWGEPVWVETLARPFLVKSDRLLDPEIFTPGRLLTLTGTLRGSLLKPVPGQPQRSPLLFQLGEVYPWMTPQRYGLHSGADPEFPFWAGEELHLRGNPYDPGYDPYPYSPFDLRP